MVKKESTSKLLNKLNIRTILKSKLQFLAVILITALAMTLYVGLTSNAKSIKNRVDKLYDDANIADIWTTTAINDSKDIEEINKLIGPGGKTEGRFVIPARLHSFNATALMMDSLPTINKAIDTDNTDDENFLIIDKRLLETQGAIGTDFKWVDDNGNYLEIPIRFSIANYIPILKNTKLGHFDGKDVTIYDAFNACLVSGKHNILEDPYLKINMQVTGSMSFAENVQSSIVNNSSFILSRNYFKTEFLTLLNDTYKVPDVIDKNDPMLELKTYLKLLDMESYVPLVVDELTKDNQYVSKVDPNIVVDNAKDNIQNYFNNKSKNNLLVCTNLDNLYSNLTIQNDIIQARQLAYIFPVIFFLVAILVVLTTISQIIIKERLQIGTMKALGISTSRIVIHYMALGIYIVLIGIVIGIIAGPFIIPQIMNNKYDILYSLPKMTFTISLPEMIVSALITLLVTALVTFIVVIKTARLKPTESMRPKEIKIAKATKHDFKITKSSIPFRMAIRNIKLNIAKSLMVILGICGCTALLVCGFGIDNTLNKGIETDSKHFFNADAFVAYNENSSKIDDLKQINDVKEVEEYGSIPSLISFNNQTYQSFVFVMDDNSKFFKLDDFILKDKIIVCNKVAKELNIKVGDTINFSSAGINFEGKVGYIMESFYMQGIIINSSFSDYSNLKNIKTNAWINFESNADKDKNIKTISQITGVSNAKSYEESIELIDSYMSSLSLMTLAVKVFAILLAITVLYNLTLLNFKERLRDIATLKVLGFSKFEISNSLFFESMLLTIVGVIIGLFLGLPMEILVLKVNMTPLVEFLYTVKPLSYLISFILTIGTAAFVNFLLTTKIKDVKMVESLKSVE